uniref:(d)CMP kinase n=1 Tax=Halomonas halophila TaxID=29573 RepID=UPI0036D35C8B
MKFGTTKIRPREISPLTKAADAIEVDTTAMSIEEVVRKILDIVHETVFRK